jgi:hypothetical protein
MTRGKNTRQPPLEVTIAPPEKPDPEDTARRLRGLRELAEQIRARLEREKGKQHDDAA